MFSGNPRNLDTKTHKIRAMILLRGTGQIFTQGSLKLARRISVLGLCNDTQTFAQRSLKNMQDLRARDPWEELTRSLHKGPVNSVTEFTGSLYKDPFKELTRNLFYKGLAEGTDAVKGSSAHANPGHMYTQRPFSSLTVTCARKWRSHVHNSETHGHMYTQVRSSEHASDGHMYTHVIVTRGHMYTPLLWGWGGVGW